MVQTVLTPEQNYQALDRYIRERMGRRIFLVHGRSFPRTKAGAHLRDFAERQGIALVSFTDFSPNPRYEAVIQGVERFRRAGCDSIIAAGGGSAMDTAKCVKLWANLAPGENCLRQEIVPNQIPLLAIPTTAGSGSEATRFAVIYYGGEKQSIAHESCLPSAVLLDPSALGTLPDYHRKSAMLDALCHGVESFWSVRSSEESRDYSEAAIRGVLRHLDGYLDNRESGWEGMLQAAHLAGKAINIAQTTAGHAMSYKLTSLYGIAHGHAAALCVARLWPCMLEHPERWRDPRGEGYREEMLARLGAAMGRNTPQGGAEAFQEILRRMDLTAPVCTREELRRLVLAVNPVRLGNHPVSLDAADMEALYGSFLACGGGRDD